MNRMMRMKRQIALLAAMAVVIAAAAACAHSKEIKTAGYLSKQAAESIYTAVYLEYLAGNVTEENKTLAAAYYDSWFEAQKGLHAALAIGDAKLAEERLRASQQLTDSMLELATRLGVF